MNPPPAAATPPPPGDVERALAAVDPADRHLACLCAVLAGPRAESLARGFAADRSGPMVAAVNALVGLDRANRLKYLAGSLPRASHSVAVDAVPRRLAAVIGAALAAPERALFLAKARASHLADAARDAHPALRLWAQRTARAPPAS